ncbi:MAG: CPBP family intramembrane metalloprotease [Oscillospiraceae bacterium]|jgi:membrane protease YdiL (CAAX protease family)|nr:CPBP family intramembrane metalloprotease [Oscillospiraceae bacterium]
MAPTIPQALLWILGYLLTMLLYTIINIVVCRRRFPRQSQWLSLFAMLLCCGGYLALLARSGCLPPLSFPSLPGLLAALFTAPALYLLCDCGIDPLLEKRFPRSEASYAQAAARLASQPVSGFFQAVLLSPVMEELLMRGLLLPALSPLFGPLAALLLSSLLFALLHFNWVQTLSALSCGLALGLLSLLSGSLFCCVLAHLGYNLLSFLLLLRKYQKGA